MRTLLVATTLLAPTLVLAQVPLRPPGQPAQTAQGAPTTTPPAPDAAQPPAPGAPRPAVRPAPAPGVRPGVRPGQPGVPAPGAAQAQGAQGGPPGRAETTPAPARDGRCVPLQGRFMLTFNRADIVDVLEQASRWTCRNFIYTEDVARGKITLLSKTAVNADEAYAAFLAALTANNIAVYPTGQYYKLIRNADAKKNPIPTYTGEDAGTPATEQPMTKVIRLQNVDADQLRGVLGNFISPQGADLQAIPPDTLIITDIGLNLRRIERLVDAIDRGGRGDQIRIIQVRYAAAKDVADKLNQIFQSGGAGAPGGRGARRTVIAPAPTGARRPGAPATGAAGGEGGAEVSVTRIIPDERTNKLVVVANERSFDRIEELLQQLDVPTSAEGGIHVVFLKNANAEDLAQTLSNLAQGQATTSRRGTQGGPVPQPPVPGMPGVQNVGATTAARPAGAAAASAELLSGEVKITADKAQNAIIVQASGSDFLAVKRLIDRLDRPRRQVFIESVIMEVNLRNEDQFGVAAHGLVTIPRSGDDAVVPIVSAPGRINTLGPFANIQNIVGLGGFLTGAIGPVSAELSALGIELPSLGVMVQALQKSADVNILSTPHLLASDNEESEITVGQNVPFQSGYAPPGLGNLLTSGQGGATAVGAQVGLGGLNSLYAPIQRQNVELRLKIKPQVSEGENVRLVIEEQTEEIVDRDPQLGPTTAKRSVKTQIVAKDQSTIVIGGLIQERDVNSVSKIPFLGSLPIVGWLFRDSVKQKQRTNLLLFLTPYIIRDERDYRRIYEKKRKEQDEFVRQFYGRAPEYKVDVDLDRKAGPVQRMRRSIEQETQKLENGGPGLPGEGVTVPPSERLGRPPEEAPGESAPETPAEPGTPEQPVERLEVQPQPPGATPPGAAPPAPQPPEGAQPPQPSPAPPPAPRTQEE